MRKIRRVGVYLEPQLAYRLLCVDGSADNGGAVKASLLRSRLDDAKGASIGTEQHLADDAVRIFSATAIA